MKKKKNKKFFLYISFIGLIDIILSCLVYNIIINRFDALKNFYKNYQFLSIDYVEHVYIPFFYLIFFLFSNIKNISLKKIYISFIHPFLYFMIFITIGIYDKNFDKYPYSFMDPKRGKCLLKFVYNVEPKGWIGVGINFLLIALIIYLLSYFLIKIKNIFLKK
ncbi:putative membrane protein [Candidatus Phytoplasma oryzae]|uniref:Putative membrane protein n=1 Tax=Candidatus Phytoplasma oryzae TaxID=203274 RepID=A0A139JQD5_9MOLU|nr:hypothetical protein [Candidatus Phytoplasma oryzae]KXT29074.1 putative membrane protein [Candidatus Phytoplasma oryzae]